MQIRFNIFRGFWFCNQQDSFTNMIVDRSAWSLMCQFRLKWIQSVGPCNFLSKAIPRTNTFRKERLSIRIHVVTYVPKLQVMFSRLFDNGTHASSSSSSICVTLSYIPYLPFTKRAALRCTISNLSELYFWWGCQTVALYSRKDRTRAK